jgi:hypothetical protein
MFDDAWIERHAICTEDRTPIYVVPYNANVFTLCVPSPFQCATLQLPQLSFRHLRIAIKQLLHPLLKRLDHNIRYFGRRPSAQGRVHWICERELERQRDLGLVLAKRFNRPATFQMRHQPVRRAPRSLVAIACSFQVMRDIARIQICLGLPADAFYYLAWDAEHARGERLGQVAPTYHQTRFRWPFPTVCRVGRGPARYCGGLAVWEERSVALDVCDDGVDGRCRIREDPLRCECLRLRGAGQRVERGLERVGEEGPALLEGCEAVGWPAEERAKGAWSCHCGRSAAAQ